MKYAIVEDGGKQYKAVEGGIIEVDLFPSEIDEQIDMELVLLVNDGEKVTVGTPTVPGAKVTTTVLAHIKGPKVSVFKYKDKKRIRVRTGHRQKYTQLRVDAIEME